MKRINLRKLALYSVVATIGGGLALPAVLARAAGIPDDALTYTGYLEDADGNPLDGEHSIAVQLFAESEGGDDLCTAKNDTLEIVRGRFQLDLSKCTAVIQGNPTLWLDVQVDGPSLGRTKLGAVPFALEAAHASNTDHATSADSATSAKKADSATKATSADAATTATVAAALKSASVHVSTSCIYASGTTDCSCPAGETAIGGIGCTGIGCGGDGASALVESAPLGGGKWRVSCQVGGVRAACANPGAVCLKVQ
jgi:hypothetical protein